MSAKQKYSFFRTLNYLLTFLCIVAGISFILAGVSKYNSTKNFEQHTGRVEGELVEKIRHYSRYDQLSIFAYTFQPKGSSIIYRDESEVEDLYFEKVDKGSRLTILYDTTNPSISFINGSQDTTANNNRVILFGSILAISAMLWGICSLYLYKKQTPPLRR